MMKILIQTLREGNHSLVIGKARSTENGIAEPLPTENNDLHLAQEKEASPVLTFDGRGVSDLFRLLHESPSILQGAQLADKVVGKGAAALMALGKVKEVYAEVISEPALGLLEQEGIRASYGRLVPHIINREGTGLCPVETRCLPCHTPAECLAEIKAFLEEMKRRKAKK